MTQNDYTMKELVMNIYHGRDVEHMCRILYEWLQALAQCCYMGDDLYQGIDPAYITYTQKVYAKWYNQNKNHRQ